MSKHQVQPSTPSGDSTALGYCIRCDPRRKIEHFTHFAVTVFQRRAIMRERSVRASHPGVKMINERKCVTSFGTVTPDHVTYTVHRGWLRGGSPEDVPLHRVSRVELETRRHPISGILLVLAALACRAMGPMGIVVAIVPLAVAILLLWGSPLVRVHTADGEFRLISGLPWTRAEAEWFVAAVDHRRVADASPPTPSMVPTVRSRTLPRSPA